MLAYHQRYPVRRGSADKRSTMMIISSIPYLANWYPSGMSSQLAEESLHYRAYHLAVSLALQLWHQDPHHLAHLREACSLHLIDRFES